MFDLVSSWLLGIWSFAPETRSLVQGNLSAWVQTTNVRSLLEPRLTPDQTALAVVADHITALEEWGLPTEQQGIWLQVGRTVLAEHKGTTPLPAASLTKIATTLVALETWGVNHQFETLIGYRGTVANGVLTGDLIIQGGGDPFFVWEEAIALGNALNQAGIRTITGDLVISGPFAMNFQAEPVVAGALLRQGMNSNTWGYEAQQQFATMPPNTPRPAVTLQGYVRVQPPTETAPLTDLSGDVNHRDDTVGVLMNSGAGGIAVEGVAGELVDVVPLIRHRSVPLIEMLRQMNIYSNNFMADALAEGVGGADVVAQRAAVITGVPLEEIQLINGSGLGVENRLSARAVCMMMIAVQGMLKQSGWSVADVLPVVGLDEGTIRNRDLPPFAAVKTGTLATVSSLSGAIPTTETEEGVVWFSIINWGSDLDGLRSKQDKLLNALVSRPATGGAIARRGGQHNSDFNRDLALGAVDRNEILAQF